jgi:hypothetical protein
MDQPVRRQDSDESSIDFGEARISGSERLFYRRFNDRIVSLCRSLPDSAQTDAILFLMRYCGIVPHEGLDFFRHYYPPAWSILYWLCHKKGGPAPGRLSKGDVSNAVTAHSMALFLHSLDDHLLDGQIPVSLLTLLLRSQAWRSMDEAFRNLGAGVAGGMRTAEAYTDGYCTATEGSREPDSLDSYCDLFRKQMGIGMVAPVLVCMKTARPSGFTRDIGTAYGSFGVAWRLLDDIRDLEADIRKGLPSALYFCLPRRMRASWKNAIPEGKTPCPDSTNEILDYIREHGLIGRIKERVCAELTSAASTVETHHMRGLASEFRSLARPLITRDGAGETSNGETGVHR